MLYSIQTKNYPLWVLENYIPSINGAKWCDSLKINSISETLV